MAKSQDARDKYFPVAVGSFDPAAGSGLAAELPALEAAGSALAAVSVELASLQPELQSCKRLKSLKASMRSRAKLAYTVYTVSSFDAPANDALLAEARRAILEAKSALHA